MQAINNDIAAALTGSVASDGQTPQTGQLRGLVSANPGYSFVGDLNTGFGSDVAEEVYLQANGTKTVRVTAAGIQITGTLSVTGAITAGSITVSGAAAFNGGITCDTDRFTVADTTGNTVIQGTLNVAGTTAGTTFTGTSFTATGAVSGATVAGAMVGTQAENETGTATDKAVVIGRQHFNPKHPKAWCNFNGTGTPTIAVGSGVSSITDNGTGDYTLNWTTPFSTANYCTIGSVGAAADGSSMVLCFDRSAAPAQVAPTASASRLNVFTFGGGVLTDVARIYVAAFGDLS